MTLSDQLITQHQVLKKHDHLQVLHQSDKHKEACYSLNTLPKLGTTISQCLHVAPLGPLDPDTTGWQCCSQPQVYPLGGS
jgi:hypothetical protein